PAGAGLSVAGVLATGYRSGASGQTAPPPQLSHSDRLRHQDFLAQHVGDLHRHGGLANGRLQRVLASHEIGLAGRHVGADHVEYGTIVGRVDHHAVHHGTPVGDLGLDYTGLLRQALQDARGDKILDLHMQLAALAPYHDAGPCLLVLDETAVLGVVAQLDDLDVVRVGLLLAQAVPFGQ